MNTYIVIFDLGIYRMDYSENDGFILRTNDFVSKYDFSAVNIILDYMKLEKYDENLSLQTHNDFAIRSYLSEYTSFINNEFKDNRGKIVPLLLNCFVINFDGNAEQLMNTVTRYKKYDFIRAIVLPFEKFISNLNRETQLQVEYLKTQEMKK